MAENSLEKIDPYFHEPRKYLSPVTHRGREIIGYFGSCKEPGCGYSSGWTTDLARTLGFWTHRADKIKTWRLEKLTEELDDSAMIVIAMENITDKHSHTYEGWSAMVDVIIRRRLGLAGEGAVNQIRETELKVYYDIGRTAGQVAARAIRLAYDVS